ncbi:MAG: hypothetical protein M1835_004916 [Candelina submexicana]|nr:MAG: hypothetical protein M1835_004916 [Candelina submexicana]
MKSGIFAFAAVALLQLAVAQPHRQRHHHEKRDGSPVVVLYYRPGEETPFSTGYENAAPAPTSTSAAVAAAQAPAASTTASSAVASSSAASGSSGSSGSSSSSASGLSITYTPYDDKGGCITDSNKIKAAFDKLSAFKMVRLYGTDCNQVANILPIAKAKGMKIFAGVFDLKQVSSEVQTIINAGKDSWDTFDTISIGNEIVQKGGSPDLVTGAISTARAMLSKAGYKGNVVTVDTAGSHLDHPELCQASDYCAVNCHAFFDQHTVAKDAGKFVLGQAQSVASKSGKRVVITETGWPKQGTSGNGLAMPGTQNHIDAISSIKQAFSSDLFLFSAFDEKWKPDDDKTCGAEKFWGLHEQFLG